MGHYEGLRVLRLLTAAPRLHNPMLRRSFVTSRAAVPPSILVRPPMLRLSAPARRASSTASAAGSSASHRQIILTLLQYVWPAGRPALRARVVVSLALLVAAKLLNIQVPFLFKALADTLEEGQRERAVQAFAATLGGAEAGATSSDAGKESGVAPTPAAEQGAAAAVARPQGEQQQQRVSTLAVVAHDNDSNTKISSDSSSSSKSSSISSSGSSSGSSHAPPRVGLAPHEVWAAIPLSLLLAYGLARSTSAGFAELRNVLFASVAQRAIRLVSRDVYSHLFALDHRFHMERSTGALQRVMDRGSRSINFVLSSLVFNVVPTALEIGLVSAIFASQCGIEYAGVTLATLAGYIGYTVRVTAYRTDIRKDLNRLEQRAASISVDGLLNYDAVKAFGNEAAEVSKYDTALAGLDKAALKTQSSLSALNFGQNLIFSAGLTAAMALASRDIASGAMSLGDLILVNGLLFQLSIPLNFVGMVYRELRQGLTDMDAMFRVLGTASAISDPRTSGSGSSPRLLLLPPPLAAAAGIDAAATSSPAAATTAAAAAAAVAALPSFDPDVAIRFSDVHFRYAPDRPVLRGLSFTVRRGETVGVVGASGCGKSTIVRLLFRFYDIEGSHRVIPPVEGGLDASGSNAAVGAAVTSAAAGSDGNSSSSDNNCGGGGVIDWPAGIYIHGQDVRSVRLDSLRRALCTVPQDTTLFNASVHDNIAYGAPGSVATRSAVEAAARTASLHATITSWPQGYETRVGERGLKLSGGEKQRVAVARAVLKDAPILLCDEATSALDSSTETAVVGALASVARGRTTLTIAHRLSTVKDADKILVLHDGALAEEGTHAELLARGGVYARLWEAQREQAQAAEEAAAGASDAGGVAEESTA